MRTYAKGWAERTRFILMENRLRSIHMLLLLFADAYFEKIARKTGKTSPTDLYSCPRDRRFSASGGPN